MTKDKYILILGAGLMQKPAIESARELGYKSIVVDANPSALCATFADRFEPIDLKDVKRILSLAQSLGDSLVGVFTAGTDFSASVSYVAEKCGLPSHSLEAAKNASDKLLMRKCFEECNVPSPSFIKVDRSQITSFLLPKTLNSIVFPKVVKPVDNMGARGCRMIRNSKEFLPAIEDAIRNSKTGRAILEDYMEGDEFSIDAIIYNNTFTVTGFADRHIYFPPYFIEMGHTMPTVVEEGKRLELIKTFAQGAKALGLSCGVAKADIKYTKKGPMIGEIAGRLSGGYMSGWTYPYASGINITQQAMLVSCGREPEELLQKRIPLPIKDAPFAIYEVPCLRTAAERAWISIPGVIKEIYGGDQMQYYPFVKDVLFRERKNSSVVFPCNNVEKCGNCISVASSHDIAVNSAEFAVSQVVLRLEENNKETDNFLNGNFEKSCNEFPPPAYDIEGAEEVKQKLLSKVHTIKKAQKVSDLLKYEELKDFAALKDWNNRTLEQSLNMFDKLCHNHISIPFETFWNALVRGGLQGILYVADSLENAEIKRKRFSFGRK